MVYGTMKVIEAMNELKLIKKKQEKNIVLIQKYASGLETEKPIFETEDKQKTEIQKLLQSQIDLSLRKLELKAKIEYTNLICSLNLRMNFREENLE